MMLVHDPLFYLAGIPAVFLFGISKGGFGGGLGILAVPMLALVISPAEAASVLLPVLCILDLIGLKAYYRKWDRVNLRLLLPGAVVGILFGTVIFRWLNADFFRFLLGVVAILFSIEYFLRSRFRSGSLPIAPNAMKGLAAGLFSGFTSFIAHAGGPPLSIYLLPQQMPQTIYVATTVVFFTAVNYLKLIPYGWLGLLHVSQLTASLALLPFAAAGFLGGVWLHDRIPASLFYRTCYLLVALTGLLLVADGLPVSFA